MELKNIDNFHLLLILIRKLLYNLPMISTVFASIILSHLKLGKNIVLSFIILCAFSSSLPSATLCFVLSFISRIWGPALLLHVIGCFAVIYALSAFIALLSLVYSVIHSHSQYFSILLDISVLYKFYRAKLIVAVKTRHFDQVLAILQLILFLFLHYF